MKKISLLLAALGFVVGTAQAATTKEVSEHALGDRSVYSERATIERIKPIGKICIQGQECPGAPVAAIIEAPATDAGAASGARSGADIYKTTCATCHAAGIAGAPKLGDKAAWAPRIAQGKDTLYKHAISGFNAMPPKGTCMTCSDDEIKATVDFMIK